LYVITFYSFKGGVGRTMALVNVAAELVRRGRKVLVVDFDLEAPGLETYKLLRPTKPHPGIVEYVTQYRQAKYQVPELLPFIYETKPFGKKGGRLWVMPAGRRDRAYRNALVNLDWKRLYQDQDGFLLFEDTKKGWEIELNPDYVLIDSRTGDTDVLGICTRQLPDAVVLMFTPNEQNLVGLEGVCRDIRRESTEGLKKDIRLHFVAANVPDLDDEDQYLRRHLNRFRARLRISHHVPIPIIHRNETLQMLNQPIFVLQRPHSRLAGEYRSLVRLLQIDNYEDREGALLFLREVQKERSKLLDSRIYRVWLWKELAPPEALERINQITAQFWNDVEVLFRVAQYLFQHQEPSMALKRINRVLELQPDDGDALLLRALCHRALRDHAAGAEDLLHYLHDHASDPEKNATAILGLLSIAVDEFLKTLDLPPVKVPTWWPSLDSFGNSKAEEDSHGPMWLLSDISLRLIQQRRWDDAIRCLEHRKVKEAIETGKPDVLAPSWKALCALHLAIAHWGKTGEPRREFCLQALCAYEPITALLDSVPNSREGMDDDPYLYFRFHGAWFQDLALLHWGAGDAHSALAALDKALAWLGQPGQFRHMRWDREFLLYPLLVVSSWTFQREWESEFRNGCDEMRRMFQGEAIRPPFLGPQRPPTTR
jgi:cellulose biosynthesis protein BcsQ